MEITNAVKARTTKSAHVTGASDKTAAREAVMAYFGETEGSLFGWSVLPVCENRFKVVLHTD